MLVTKSVMIVSPYKVSMESRGKSLYKMCNDNVFLIIWSYETGYLKMNEGSTRSIQSSSEHY